MKRFQIMMALLLCTVLFAGCAGTTVVYSECTCGACTPAPTPTQTTAPMAEGALKTGLSVVASVSGENAGESDGKVSFDVIFAAVTVDENGVIASCVLDNLGTDVLFNASGAVTTDLTAQLQTKKELGDAYGMKAYAGATYEWYEQANAVANYAVGKTVDAFLDGAVTESGYAKDADLATSATIYIGTFATAIEKAVRNARVLGAEAGDTLRLATISALSFEDGTLTLTSDVTALTENAGTITSCYLDSLQTAVTIDETGAITSDLTAVPQTKNELGDAYGMKAYAGATYEWYEQAQNFATYVTGKTASEVAGIAVTEATKPQDADLASTVTIAIGGFQSLIAKAMQG